MYLPQTYLQSISLARGLPAIFVHTPKCGGSFVAAGIGRKRERHCFTRRYPLLKGHKTWMEYRELFPKFGLDIADFVTFSVVRNPWAWHVSFYHYVRQLVGRNREKAAELHARLNTMSFTEYLAWVDQPGTTENEIASVNDVCHWIVDGEGRIAVDVVMRQERLEQDFSDFIRRYGLRLQIPAGRVNESRHADYRSYYTDCDADLVARRHHRDVVLFGYSFDS